MEDVNIDIVTMDVQDSTTVKTTVDGSSHDDIQAILIETMGRDVHAEDAKLVLPENKEAHLFVSYSSDDRDVVHPLIADLEGKFEIKCIFDDRDFLPGMEIHENIKRGMEKSMKILLVLSENFLKSGYCKYETDLAFVLSMESGGNHIIPVMLEECRIPNTLRTLTYVDATKEGDNLSNKIIEAYINTDSEALPVHFDGSHGSARPWGNGDTLSLPCVVEKSCCLRPAKKYIEIDDSTRFNIAEDKYPVSNEILEEAVDVVNSFCKSSLWSKSDPWVLVGFIFCFIPFAYGMSAVFEGVKYVSLLGPVYSGKADDIMPVTALTTAILIPGLPVGALIVWVFAKLQSNRSFTKLSRNLYDRVTSSSYKKGVLFDLIEIPAAQSNGYRRSLNLRIIRYDVLPCQKYLQTMVEKLYNEIMEGTEVNERASSQDVAESLIENHLKEYCLEFNKLELAPVHRHHVRGGKLCVCQMLQKYVLTEHRNKASVTTLPV